MKTVRIVLFALVILWILGCSEGWSTNPAVSVGNPAPEARLESLREPGKFVSISDFKGKVLMLDFWATWCGPCIASMPEVQKLWDMYHDKGLEIVGITQEDRTVVKKFFTLKPLTYPIYLDGSMAANTKYGISEIPTVVIIDRQGKIAFVGHPAEPEMMQALEASLKG